MAAFLQLKAVSPNPEMQLVALPASSQSLTAPLPTSEDPILHSPGPDLLLCNPALPSCSLPLLGAHTWPWIPVLVFFPHCSISIFGHTCPSSRGPIIGKYLQRSLWARHCASGLSVEGGKTWFRSLRASELHVRCKCQVPLSALLMASRNDFFPGLVREGFPEEVGSELSVKGLGRPVLLNAF